MRLFLVRNERIAEQGPGCRQKLAVKTDEEDETAEEKPSEEQRGTAGERSHAA
jgi:hypothetical protein